MPRFTSLCKRSPVPFQAFFVINLSLRMRNCHKKAALRGPNTFPSVTELWALSTNNSGHCGIWSRYITLNLVQNELKCILGSSEILVPLLFIKLCVCHFKTGLITRSHPQVSFSKALTSHVRHNYKTKQVSFCLFLLSFSGDLNTFLP